MAVREQAIDPIVLEVLWNRIISVTNEQAAALIRTSFTSIVREAQDLSAGVFDPQGNMIAQSVTGTPGHINSMATCVRHFLAAYPPESLEPGDVLVTNNPWLSSGHLNDLTVVTPIFKGQTLVALFANTCHSADFGGRPLSADAKDVYEEGLYIPITKLYIAGEPNQELFRIIRGNVRVPDMVLGDIHAQVACNDVGGRRLLEFMEEFGFENIDGLAEAIISRSERAMRAAIAQMTPEVYENEVWSDGYEEPVRIKVKITVVGDGLTVDYAGTSPQSRYGINVVFNYTHAYTTFGVKAAISPEVPNNEGSFRPVKVTAPPGCILNALHPAPVAARHILGHFLPGALFGALAQALPDRLMAEGAASIAFSQANGYDRRGRPFAYTFFSCGGTGARPNKDGLSNTGFPSGVAGVPAEVIESLSPFMVLQREMRPDSGGPGKYRGGCGQVLSLKVRTDQPYTFATMFDRTRFPAQGLHGGQPGALGDFFLSTGERRPPKQLLVMTPEMEAHILLPGGGGYFNPLERDPQAVLEDVVNGLVSIESAAKDYGVVIRSLKRPEDIIATPDDFAIDWEATAELRPSLEGLRRSLKAAQGDLEH